MNTRPSKLAYVAALSIAGAACTAPHDGLSPTLEHVGAAESRLDVAPGSVPYPAASINGVIQFDQATGHMLPAWSGSVVDLMAADAWAQCGAHVTTAADQAQDAYQSYLEARISIAECPNAITATVPSGALTINNCGNTVATCTAMKRWARQRQMPRCNVSSSTGLASAVQFYSNASVGRSLPQATAFASIASTSDALRQQATSNAQKEVDIADINLCMAQRLRENVASADSLFLSAEDLRELLEVIRERSQIAMMQYALIGRVFTNPDDRPGQIISANQVLPILMAWSKLTDTNSLNSLTGMGEDLAAAVELEIESTREMAEYLARNASARVDRGGKSASLAQEDWGAGSWRQRLLALLYGGNPMGGANSTAEVDLSDGSNPLDALSAALGNSQKLVPWDTAWTDDGLPSWLWPNQLAPLSPAQRYATTDVTDPRVHQLLTLARRGDAILLKELIADATIPPNANSATPSTMTFRRVDVDGSVPQFFALVEASLQTQECLKANPSCSIVSPSDASVPSLQNYDQSLLWKKYLIDPSHVKTLVSMLADLVPRYGEMDGFRIIAPQLPSILQESEGARHLLGAQRLLTGAALTARLPTATGTWYHLDPTFGTSPNGNPERAPLYTAVDPYLIPRAFDKWNLASAQGFDQGNAAKRLGAMSALAAARELFEDAIGSASDGLKGTYFSKAPRAVTAINAAIGQRSFNIRPSVSTRSLYRYCNDWEPWTPAATQHSCSSTVQNAAADGTTAAWDISVRSDKNDPMFSAGNVSLIVVPSTGLEGSAAVAANFESIRGQTRDTILEFSGHVEATPDSVTDLGASAQSRRFHVDLPTILPVFGSAASTTAQNANWSTRYSVLLKRTGAAPTTEYQVLAQSMQLTVNGGFRTVDNGFQNAVVYLPEDGQYFAYGGVLGGIASRVWATRGHDWARPSYDGFGLPTDWVPPSDPSLFGAAASEDVVGAYVKSAQSAADEATSAVRSAIDELLKEQTDDATLATAQRKAAAISQIEQRTLCGDGNPTCDTSTRDYNLFGDATAGDKFIPVPTCADTICGTLGGLEFAAIPPVVRLATAVFAHRNDPSAPAFNEYAGGSLQKIFVEQWTSLNKVKRVVVDAMSGIQARAADVAAAQAELDRSTAVNKYECSNEAMQNALYAGYQFTVGEHNNSDMLFADPSNGFEPPNPKDERGWSPGPLYAQLHACQSSTLAMPPDAAKVASTVADGWSWTSTQSTALYDAGGVLQATAAEFAKALQDANLAKASADLDASLSADTLVTKFGTYRRYHSYDVWRARALLESARRYAVAARRAIEARYVIDLSTMESDEPFVAAPATWADEVYEYDLDAPAAVGLTVSSQQGNGIYPNRLSDYVGNLQRLVQGYAVARPTAVAHKDDDMVELSGPDVRIAQTVDGAVRNVLSGDAAAWEFICPESSAWVQHPGLGTGAKANTPITEMCQNRLSPTRARVSFWLDAWGRLEGDIAIAPYSKRHNARWVELAVNLVGTEIRDCSRSTDPSGCYAAQYLHYDLTHTGPMWVTNFDEQWRQLGEPSGRIEGAKALSAEQWLDPVGNGFVKPYVDAVARSEFLDQPLGGTYVLELEITPDVRLDHIDRVQLLSRSNYWVKQQ